MPSKQTARKTTKHMDVQPQEDTANFTYSKEDATQRAKFLALRLGITPPPQTPPPRYATELHEEGVEESLYRIHAGYLKKEESEKINKAFVELSKENIMLKNALAESREENKTLEDARKTMAQKMEELESKYEEVDDQNEELWDAITEEVDVIDKARESYEQVQRGEYPFIKIVPSPSEPPQVKKSSDDVMQDYFNSQAKSAKRSIKTEVKQKLETLQNQLEERDAIIEELQNKLELNVQRERSTERHVEVSNDEKNNQIIELNNQLKEAQRNAQYHYQMLEQTKDAQIRSLNETLQILHKGLSNAHGEIERLQPKGSIDVSTSKTPENVANTSTSVTPNGESPSDAIRELSSMNAELQAAYATAYDEIEKYQNMASYNEQLGREFEERTYQLEKYVEDLQTAIKNNQPPPPKPTIDSSTSPILAKTKSQSSNTTQVSTSSTSTNPPTPPPPNRKLFVDQGEGTPETKSDKATFMTPKPIPNENNDERLKRMIAINRQKMQREQELLDEIQKKEREHEQILNEERRQYVELENSHDKLLKEFNQLKQQPVSAPVSAPVSIPATSVITPMTTGVTSVLKADVNDPLAAKVKQAILNGEPAHKVIALEEANESINNRKHLKTGRSHDELPIKHQDLRDTIGYHLKSLRTMGNGRPEKIDVKVRVDLTDLKRNSFF
jgi:hypothetical protein